MEYGVEYNVLQEEMSTPRPQTRKIKQLEDANKTLIAQNKALQEQLEVNNFMNNIHRLIIRYEQNSDLMFRIFLNILFSLFILRLLQYM